MNSVPSFSPNEYQAQHCHHDQAAQAEVGKRTSAPDASDLPVGTRVLAFPGSRDGRAILTRTRTAVHELGGTLCVGVEGYAGGIALTHIEVLP